jgi:hypothetical protein
MGHRCRDDFWLWAAILVATANNDCRTSSCCCEERQRDSYNYDRAFRSERATIPTQKSRKPVLVIAAVGVVVVLLIALAFNSHANDSSVQPIQPAPVNLAVTPAETRSETPIGQAFAPAVEPRQQTLTSLALSNHVGDETNRMSTSVNGPFVRMRLSIWAESARSAGGSRRLLV